MNIINSLTSTAKHFIIVTFAIVLSFFSPAKNIQTNKISTGIKPNTAIVTPTPTINISQSMADSKQILVDLEKALNVTAEITDKWSSINWFVNGKEIVPLICQAFTIGTSASSHTGKYGNFAQYPDSNYLKDVTEDALKPLQSEVNEFFLSNRFQKDDLNTFRNSESYVLLFIGYTKGDLKCLFRLNPKSSLFGNFFCGIVDQARLTWRKELTPAINTTNDSNIVVSVNKLLGNYAQGSVGSSTGQGGGAGWYAVKINGQWKEVSRGQNMSPESCKSLVQQYNFPKEILDCESRSTLLTPIPTMKVKTTGLTIKYWKDSYYCEPEVIPTFNLEFNVVPTRTPSPTCPKIDNSPESISCQLNQMNSEIVGGGDRMKHNLDVLNKYCTKLTPTPK